MSKARRHEDAQEIRRARWKKLGTNAQHLVQDAATMMIASRRKRKRALEKLVEARDVIGKVAGMLPPGKAAHVWPLDRMIYEAWRSVLESDTDTADGLRMMQVLGCVTEIDGFDWANAYDELMDELRDGDGRPDLNL